jgi:hypothetical protein
MSAEPNGEAQIDIETTKSKLLNNEAKKVEEASQPNVDSNSEQVTNVKKFLFSFKKNPDLKNILLLVFFYVIQGNFMLEFPMKSSVYKNLVLIVLKRDF